jgi:hypothetical protein
MRKLATVLALFQVLLAPPVWAESAASATGEPHCTALKPGKPRHSESIGILYSPSVPRELVEGAVELWAGCEGYGTEFPPLLIGREGTQTIKVKLVKGGSTGPRCGSFVGRAIVLHAFARDSKGRLQSCGSRADGLAHELGHFLGLLDSPETAGCRDHAMALVDVSERNRRAVKPEECRAVAERWVTPSEEKAAGAPVILAGVEP